MSLRSIAMLALALLASAGCVTYSLKPPYLDSDLTSEPRLLGSWKEVSTSASRLTLSIESRPGGELRIVERGSEGRFTARAHLFRLQGELFLDVEPDQTEQGRARTFALLSCHYPFCVRFAGDTLAIGPLASEWLRAAARGGDVDSSRVAFTADGDALLTLDTAGLQNVLRRAAADSGAFMMTSYVRR